VATVLIQEGTLKKGDRIVAGQVGGKIRRLLDDTGKTLKKAGPAAPVELLGLEEVPVAGDPFYFVAKDSELKRIIAERREERLRGIAENAFTHIPTDEGGIWDKLAQLDQKTVNLVLKTDVQGSLQVLKRELAALSTDEVSTKVIRDGVGGITTADVLLATASGSVCLGFGVTADTKARKLAREKQVEIHTYRVIYELIDGVREIMAGALDPEERENVLGQVQVRKVFKSSKLGNIAGCFVENGIVRRNAMIRLARDGIILWQGELSSLRRFKDDVKEVRENFECGIVLKGYDDVKENDIFEVFEIEKIARSLD
jgi:translation initiation factor IF-2